MQYPRPQLVTLTRILAGAGVLVLAVTLVACASRSGVKALPSSLTPLPSNSATGTNIPNSPSPQPGGTRTPSPRNRKAAPSPSSRPGSPRPAHSPTSSGDPAPSAPTSNSPRPATSPVPTTAELQAALLTVTQLPDMGFQAQPAESGSDAGSLLSACPFATTGQENPRAQAGMTSALAVPGLMSARRCFSTRSAAPRDR